MASPVVEFLKFRSDTIPPELTRVKPALLREITGFERKDIKFEVSLRKKDSKKVGGLQGLKAQR